MDLDLMINSFPKLLSATLITLKLLSASLFFGLLVGLLFAILRMNKNIFHLVHQLLFDCFKPPLHLSIEIACWF